MKRIVLIIALFANIIFAMGQTTRYWVGGLSGNFTDGAEWSYSSGGTPIGGTISWSNSDIARFDANSGSTTVSFTASETIGKLQISGNITVRMQNLYAYNYSLTIRTAASDALTIASVSTLEIQGNYDSDMTVQLYSSSGIIANIYGTVRVLTATGNTGIGEFEKGSSATINFNSGSLYEHRVNGDALPVATWNANSTCLITGVTNNSPTNDDQQFGHFTWNCTSQSEEETFAGGFGSVSGNLSILSTNNQVLKFSTTESCIINVGGNFSLGGNSYLVLSGGSADNTMNVNGNFSLTGGVFVMCSGSGYTILNIKGNFSMSTSNPFFSQNPSYNRATVNFNGASPQTYVKSSGTIYYGISFNVKTGATLDLGTSVLGDYLYSTGSFTIESGASLKTAHAEGIVSNGASGCIQVSGTRNYNVASNYTFYRNGAQASGYQFPVALEGVLTVGSTSNATNLTITGSSVTINNKLVLVSNATTSSTIASGTVAYGTSGTLEFQGLSHFNTSNSIFPNSNGPSNVVVGNTNGVSLHDSRTIPGNLNIQQASFMIGNNTLTLQGTLQMPGGTLTGGTNSNLIIGGTGSSMSLPGITLNNFTLNRASGVTLLNDMVIYGTLTLTNGIISGLSYMQKVYVVNTQSSAVSGGSANSFVNTPLARYLPQMLNNGTYFFPVGRSGNYYPFTLTEVKTGMAGIVQITVEAVAANCGGTPGAGLASLSTTEFWNATVYGGELLKARISAGRQLALGNLNAIARSSSLSGTYNNLNGTVSGNSIINSDSTVILDYIVLAEKDCIPHQLNAQYNGEESKDICAGDAYTLSANPTGGEYCSGQWQYAWYTGTGNDNTYWNGFTWNNPQTWGSWQNISNVSPTVNTTYKVKVRCSTNYNCTYTDTTGVAVTVHPEYLFMDIGEICQGDSILWRGNYYKLPGQYFDHLYTQHGCDSIYVLRLFVFPKYKFTTFAEICDGDVFPWRGQDYTQEGTYVDPYLSQHGCDSIYVLILKVHPVYFFAEYHSVYDNQLPFVWHGNDYYTSGTYYADYFTIHGCDSTYELNLTVKPFMPLRVSKQNGRAVQADWDPVPGAVMYQLRYRETPSGNWIYVAQSTQLFRKIMPLDENTEYELQFRYKTLSGWEEWNSMYPSVLFNSGLVEFSVKKDIGTKFILAWTELTGISSYVLQYKKSSDPAWTTKGYYISNTAVMGSMEEGTDYQYRICPRYSEVSFEWTHSDEIPSNIILITVTNYNGTSADFSWDPVLNPAASDYYLQIREENSPVIFSSNYTSGTSRTVSGLDAQTVYEFRLVVRYGGLAWGTTGWRLLANSKIGMSQIILHNNIFTYPNPVSDYLTMEIHATGEEIVLWSLTDVTGRLVKQGVEPVTEGVNIFGIDCSGLPAGFYIIQINKNNFVKTEMILKQ